MSSAPGGKPRPLRLFKPGTGSTPPFLAGRGEEQASLDRAVMELFENENGSQPHVVFGPRGVGKTVLIKEFAKKWGDHAHMIGATPKGNLLKAEPLAIYGRLSSNRGFWGNFKVAGATIGPKALAQIQLGPEVEAVEEEAYERIVEECKAKPKVLVVDEAHELEGDPDKASRLLNLCQNLSGETRFLLILAGTPDLPTKFSRLHATFMNRAEDVPIRRLSDEESGRAITEPLSEYGISVDPKVLERIVEDAQGHPHFLQVWGKQIWNVAYNHKLSDIADRVFETVKDEARKGKDNLYGKYFKDIMAPIHLKAAVAVAQAFGGEKSIRQGQVLAAVMSTLDHSLDEETKMDKALKIFEYLSSKDVLWEPVQECAEPAIPSFHTYIRDRARRLENDLERGFRGPTPDRDDGNDGLER